MNYCARERGARNFSGGSSQEKVAASWIYGFELIASSENDCSFNARSKAGGT